MKWIVLLHYMHEEIIWNADRYEHEYFIRHITERLFETEHIDEAEKFINEYQFKTIDFAKSDQVLQGQTLYLTRGRTT